MTSTVDDAFAESRVIEDLHNIPRFGHSNRISKLASFARADQEDYVRGILSFFAFLVIVFYVWSLIIVVLKFVFANEHVGCARGGKTIDVAKMRKDKIPRDIRRRRIIRSWRIQWVFLTASVLIPITTLLMTRNGLKTLINSLDEVESINDIVETLSFRGLAISEALQLQQNSLSTNFTQQDLDMDSLCPTASQLQSNSSILALPIATVAEYIQVGLEEVNSFISEHATKAHTSLTNAIQVTQRVDKTIEWSYANDWALKFFLLTFNVVNGFFLFGVFLTKQDIVSYSYRRFLSNAMIPFFCFLLMGSMILTCLFGVSAIMNADFCYGSTNSEGTLAEIIGERSVGESDMSYQAVVHYAEGCLGENPLAFVHNMDPLIKHTTHAVNLLEDSFDAHPAEELHTHCTDDVYILISRLPQLAVVLEGIRRQVKAVIELTSCHQISPVLRRIQRGAICSETVYSLVWMFGGLCTITVLGFVMLSVRAGLFNSVVRAPRRKRKREREKEFEEYKAYMAEFYEDADQWEMEMPEEKKAALMAEISRINTFETEQTSRSGSDDGNDASDIACFASPTSQVSAQSSTSSYESDYSSSDSEEERSTLSQSILGRIFHTRNHDDNQSHNGISMLGLDDHSHMSDSRSQLGILELQTPRRRRKHALPALYTMDDNSSHESNHSSSSSQQVLSPPSNRKSTPKAPTKPKILIDRLRGAKKES